jgi:cell division protein FtsI/penicillin-binding protein 2
MRTDSRVRIRVLSILFSLIALLLGARLYFVQIVHGASYREDALGQYVQTNPDTDERGTIFFSQKDGALTPAAIMQHGWRVAIVPKDIVDPRGVYAAISAVTPIDAQRFDASVHKTEDPYEEVAFRVPDDAASQIRAEKMPGVLLVQDSWRFYPGKDLAAQTIGFVGYKSDRKIGLYGLERSFQDTLSFTSDGRAVNPFAEIFANINAALSFDPAAHQGSVITTIEPEVERQLEDTLDGVMKTYTPKLAGGIIMDPKTGEIVAMASRPAFDPNAYNLEKDPAVFSNPLVEGRWEMGSIMKPLTMAAGIDTGSVTTATTYNDVGCIERSGAKICNYDFKARGVVPMQEVLSQSLNLGATFVEEKMGRSVFARYVTSLGMGAKTGIDLPNEVTGDIRALSGNSDVDFASASFGQGFAVSPIEMIRGLSVLADNGAMPQPHVVKAIKYESGVTRSVDHAAPVQVIKPQTAETVTDMLITVYDKALLKGAIKQEHYTIAAKTGTAQIGIPGGGGYYTDRYLHSFFGYFPAHDPKFIIFLYAVEPHGVEYASASLAHPFSDLATFLIRYYDIPPDR